MRKPIALALAFGLLLALTGGVLADGPVDPAEVNIVLPEGEEATIEKMVTVPETTEVTDVWYEVEAAEGLNIGITPDVVYAAEAGSVVIFTETISLDSGVEGVACATVTFYANTYPEAEAVIGTQSVCVSAGCLDIKPGSYPNSINRKANGVIPVALLGRVDFDVTTVDVTTLAFGPGDASPCHDLADPDVFADHLQDVNYDGNMDLVSHYKTMDAGIGDEDESACLSYQLLESDVEELCCDSVRVVK